MRKIILSFAACLALAAYGQKPVQDTRAMDTFIDQLMGKMTLDEKIGQLNLSGGGVPGILSGSEGADETIRRGWLGATGGSELETFRKLQEIAVKESRLGIPLLFGLDVIHGYSSSILLNYVRKKYSHPRIEIKILTLNKGETVFILK